MPLRDCLNRQGKGKTCAAGGSQPAGASAGGDDEAWDVERIAALDIPVLQGLCLTSSREEWEASYDGVTPLDSAT